MDSKRPLILPDRPVRFGSYNDPEGRFMVNGDFESAYIYLKELFEPKPKNKSGPIKPLTPHEKQIESNPGIAETLQSLAPETVI